MIRHTLFFYITFFISLKLIAQVSPYQIVQDMGRGLNLGNTLSAPVEGNWASIVYEQFFIDVKNEGFSNVRIPVDFYGDRTSGSTESFSINSGTASDYSGSISDFTVSSTYLNRLKTVIDWSINQGLYTVLDFHGAELKSEFLTTFNSSEPNHCEPSSAKRAADLMKFKSIWTAIANHFINYPETLIFEVVNEPYFELSADEMDALNTLIISTIRATGGNNVTRSIIITGGTLASHEAPTAIGTAIIESDDYLIASFHYYQPFNFTSSSTSNNNVFNWGSDSEKSTLMSDFESVKTWSDANNIPVTLGEFGADNTAGINYVTGIDGDYGGPVNADRVAFHNFVAEQAINRGFSFSAWCSGNKSNKTIHLRTDNPSTSNAVAGTWVTDVKNAILEPGNWPLCYGPSNAAVIVNTDFECGYSDQWNFSVLGNVAVATYSDAATDSYAGNAGGKVQVPTAQIYNKVVLSNNEYTGDLTGKTITVQGYVKTLGPDQSIKIRIKSTVGGTNSYSASDVLSFADGSLDGAAYEQVEFSYEVPEATTSVQVQLMFGQDQGTYLIDNFSVAVEDTTLGVDAFVAEPKIILFPNPSDNLVTISTNLEVLSVKIFNSIGQLVHQQNNTHRIDVNSFALGNYVLKIETKTGAAYFKKLLIK